MNNLTKALRLFGINLTLIKSNIKGLGFYFSDLKKIKKQNQKEHFGPIKYYPILNERFDESGSMSGHYFHQDLLIAQKIFDNNPTRHMDIGSRIDGFVAHVAAFRKIEIFDIRKQDSEIKNIIFRQLDLMGDIPSEYINCTDSISSLHTIEHFGLGRYGDKIDIFGHIKGLNNIKKILKSGGKFYFSVPIGTQRIEFNAHRVFSIQYLLDIFKNDYDLISFSYVDDKGDLHKDLILTHEDIANSLGCRFGCGIFEFIKK
jgi:SAM-dependent methyltransferase